MFRKLKGGVQQSISKAMSRVLRHQAQKLGVVVNAEKWADFYIICNIASDQCRFEWIVAP